MRVRVMVTVFRQAYCDVIPNGQWRAGVAVKNSTIFKVGDEIMKGWAYKAVRENREV